MNEKTLEVQTVKIEGYQIDCHLRYLIILFRNLFIAALRCTHVQSRTASSPSACSNSIKSSLAPGIALAARRSATCAFSRIFEVPGLTLQSSHRNSSRAAHSDRNGALCTIPSSITAENVAWLWSERAPLRRTLLKGVSNMPAWYKRD